MDWNEISLEPQIGDFVLWTSKEPDAEKPRIVGKVERLSFDGEWVSARDITDNKLWALDRDRTVVIGRALEEGQPDPEPSMYDIGDEIEFDEDDVVVPLYQMLDLANAGFTVSFTIEPGGLTTLEAERA